MLSLTIISQTIAEGHTAGSGTYAWPFPAVTGGKKRARTVALRRRPGLHGQERTFTGLRGEHIGHLIIVRAISTMVSDVKPSCTGLFSPKEDSLSCHGKRPTRRCCWQQLEHSRAPPSRPKHRDHGGRAVHGRQQHRDNAIASETRPTDRRHREHTRRRFAESHHRPCPTAPDAGRQPPPTCSNGC